MGSSGKSDFVARYAGDELSIILMDTAARGNGSCGALFEGGEHPVYKSWLHRADVALYAAQGGNRVK
jgi:GGDEF domain-containing protein